MKKNSSYQTDLIPILTTLISKLQALPAPLYLLCYNTIFQNSCWLCIQFWINLELRRIGKNIETKTIGWSTFRFKIRENMKWARTLLALPFIFLWLLFPFWSLSLPFSWWFEFKLDLLEKPSILSKNSAKISSKMFIRRAYS
jgi:hypothetical protein